MAAPEQYYRGVVSSDGANIVQFYSNLLFCGVFGQVDNLLKSFCGCRCFPSV